LISSYNSIPSAGVAQLPQWIGRRSQRGGEPLWLSEAPAK